MLLHCAFHEWSQMLHGSLLMNEELNSPGTTVYIPFQSQFTCIMSMWKRIQYILNMLRFSLLPFGIYLVAEGQEWLQGHAGCFGC